MSEWFVNSEPGEVLRPGEVWRDSRGRSWVVEVVTHAPDPSWRYQVRVRSEADKKAKRVFGNPPPRGWVLDVGATRGIAAEVVDAAGEPQGGE